MMYKTVPLSEIVVVHNLIGSHGFRLDRTNIDNNTSGSTSFRLGASE